MLAISRFRMSALPCSGVRYSAHPVLPQPLALVHARAGQVQPQLPAIHAPLARNAPRGCAGAQ